MHYFLTELAEVGPCITSFAYECDWINFGPILQDSTNLQIAWEQVFIWLYKVLGPGPVFWK